MKKKFSLLLTVVLVVCNIGSVFAEEGIVQLNEKYDYIFPFYEGLAPVSIKKGEITKYGVINSKGKEMTSIKYDFIDTYKEGMAAVELNKKWGYIDKKGKEIIPCKYDYAFNFSEDLAFVELKGKWGAIDKKGKVVIPFKYEDADHFKGGLCAVALKGSYGCIDKKGKSIIPFKYDIINISEDGRYIILGTYKENTFIADVSDYYVESPEDYAIISSDYRISIMNNPLLKNK